MPMERKVLGPRSDAEAEVSLEQNPSDLDLSRFEPARFELERKEARANMRLPAPLLEAVKAQAEARGIPCTRLIREALEGVVAGPEPGASDRR